MQNAVLMRRTFDGQFEPVERTDAPEALAEVLANFVNSQGQVGMDRVGTALMAQHPTLQQGVFRMFLRVASVVAAAPAHFFDGRNSATRDFCADLTEAVRSGSVRGHLPLI